MHAFGFTEAVRALLRPAAPRRAETAESTANGRAMRLAVDAGNLLTDRRGIGVYVRAVLERLLDRDDVDITLLVEHPPAMLAVLSKAALVRELGGRSNFRVASRLPRGAEVAWHPWNGTFFRPRPGTPNVATVHDVAPFAFPSADAAQRRSQQEPFERTARTAARIVADSLFTKTEIVRYLGVVPERIAVVPLAADARYTPGDPQFAFAALRGRRYVACVGAIESRKNVATLVEAWREAFPMREVALAIVTPDAVPGDVVHLSRLGIEALRDVYRGALCLAAPSIYEGFGLPPLEALACGTPVVASRASSLPEVCGDAALYVERPRSVEEWAAALRRIASEESLRAALRERGLRRAASFSWDRTAGGVVEVLRSAMRA